MKTYQKFLQGPERQHAAAPICTAREFSDASDLISCHYREPQHGVRQRQHAAAPVCTALGFSYITRVISNPNRMRASRTNITLVILFLLFFIGCSGTSNEKQAEAAGAKRVVTVSILPQEYFVHAIVGDDYKVNVMIPPGHSPATYEPTPREMKAVSESVLYFRIGHIAFEKAWMDKIASLNKKMKIVDTSIGVSLITGEPRHNHGEDAREDVDEHEHTHSGIDPHIWLSPTAVQIQVKHILDAFVELNPAGRENYEANYSRFIADIKQLHEENERILQGLKGKKFMVYHPAWSYFAREYGLIQYPIEIEGKNPGAADLKKLIDLAKGENIRVIFVQRQFDSNSARAVADEIGGKVIAMDPLNREWLANIKKIAQTFKEALTPMEEK